MYKISDYPQIQNNFFLSGRNVGASKKLVGNVNLLTVFLKRFSTDWSDSMKDRYYACVREATELLMCEAKKYGVSLNIKCFHLETSVSPTSSPMDGFNLVKDYFREKTMEGIQKHYENRMGVDEVPIILAFNETGRSFTYKKNEKELYDTQEISVVFFEENESSVLVKRTIAHELLHQFGAIDFYFPSEIKEIAKKYIGDSIMREGSALTVDDLTAYLIGWKDTISANSYWFLKETMWMNATRFQNAKRIEWN